MKTLRWATCSVVLAMTACFVSGAVADIVLAMPFEEGGGATTQDLSTFGNNGTLMGATWTTGKAGNALAFDSLGPNWVDVGTDSSLSLNATDFTIAVWANMSLAEQQHGLVAQDEGGGLLDKFILRYRGDQTLLNFVAYNSQTDVVGQINSEPWTPDLERWYQIAFVRRGDAFTYYIDAEPHGTVDSDMVLSQEIAAPFTIGWAEGPIAMDGRIDDVLVANHALDDAGIRGHFQNGVLGVVTAVAPRDKLATAWGHLKATPPR